MELPTEVVEVVEAAAPDAAPVRATRSAQRRRAVKPAGDATPLEGERLRPGADRPASPDASTEQATDQPVADAPADPVSFTPAAAIMADTTAEEQTMDTIDNAADNARNAADQMADQGQAAAADMGGRAKEAMEKTTRMTEELGAFGKGNMEAMVESSKIAAKGFEAIGQEAAEFARKQFEAASQTMKTLAATRSPTEFMKLQSDYARSTFDAMVAEASKSTEMMLKLANDVAQPLSNRVAIAADKMKAA